jgi:regulator of sirC expression with transglutaminase-like and TPR domain
MLRPWLAIAVLVLLMPLPASGQQAANETEVTRQIARLIAQLDADTFEVRERASRELERIGMPALAALEAARAHQSAEVRGRARALVEAMTTAVRRREFMAFASTPDEQLDLERGMWLIGRILDPNVKQAEMSKRLDELAAKVRARLGKGVDAATADPEKVVAALHQVLFVEAGFTGNVADYGNPDNSSLPKVLETKKGLPILLSEMTVAVARRLKTPIVNVPLSGTYLVKYDGLQAPAGFAADDIFMHPFEQGQIIKVADIDRELPGKDAAVVEPYMPRETLIRLLSNLTTALGRFEHDAQRQEQLVQVRELQQLLQAYATDAN